MSREDAGRGPDVEEDEGDGTVRRRYTPLSDRPWAVYPDPRDPLVVNDMMGHLLGVERAYVVALEDGTHTLLSQSQYDAAVKLGREAADMARERRSRVIKGTIVDSPG